MIPMNVPVNKIRVLVVDDHPLVRESLVVLLDRSGDIEVVGSAGSAEEALGLSQTLRPDVLLMDIEMPGRSPFAVARELSQVPGAARVLFLSAFLTDSHVQETLTLKGCGYMVKSASVKEIADAVRSVNQGRAYFSKEVASRFVATDQSRVARVQKLTSREREVLRCVARDLSGKEIAHELGLSVRTVDRHKANIMEKLAIHSQVGLTLYAIAEGMSDPRQSLEPKA